MLSGRRILRVRHKEVVTAMTNNKKRSTRRPSLISVFFLTVSLAGCGGGEESSDPDGNDNFLRARIDGQQFTASSSFITVTGSGTPTQSGQLIIVGPNIGNSDSLALTLGFIPGPGTYPLGTNPGTTPGGLGTYVKGSDSWTAPLNGQAGTLVITARTATRIAGTFTFTGNALLPAMSPDQRVVTEGEFDVTVAAGLPPLPTGPGSTASATIDGAYWNAGTVVAVAAGASAVSANATDQDYSITFVSATAPLVNGMTYGIPSGINLQVLRTNNQGSWFGGVGADVGTFTVTAIGADRVAGDFSATLPSLAAGPALAITNGHLDAYIATPAYSLVGIEFSATDSQLYGINDATGAGTPIGGTGFKAVNSLAFSNAGTLVSVAANAGIYSLISVDPATGTGTLLTQLNFGGAPADVRGLAFSPADVLFAIQDTAGGDNLYTVDVSTGVGTLVGATGLPGLQSLEFSSTGQLFAWDIGTTGSNGLGLVTINPATGAYTDVNPAVGGIALQSIAFDSSGALYGVTSNKLYSINTTTGVATLIGGTGYVDLRGIAFID